jgi:chaperonin GroEL
VISSSPKHRKTDFQKPSLVFQPHSYLGLQRGVNLIVDAIRPTLGPFPRFVCVERTISSSSPEILDSAGTIARRVIQIKGRDEDMGFMFVRHVLWKLQEQVGDGTATAGVLLQSIYNQGLNYLAAGGNAQRLRVGLEEALRLVDCTLEEMTVQLLTKEQLVGFIETICYERDLARILCEIYNILDPFGRLEIRSGRGLDTTHEFHQGVYWSEGPFSQKMITDIREGNTVMGNGAVLATDLEVREPEEVLHLLRLALQDNSDAVLLVVSSISEQALAILLNKQNWEKMPVLVVKTPGTSAYEQADNLEDLAVLTGGKSVIRATGANIRTITLEDFGHARRIWVYKDAFGITTGRGDPRQIRQHFQNLKLAYRRVEDVDVRKRVEKRLGRCLGGSATIWIGGHNEREFQAKRELVERTSRAVRVALQEGILPGGGIVLLACQHVLENKLLQLGGAKEDTDRHAAYRILARALEEPFRTLVANAGYEQGQATNIINGIQPGYSFDLRQRKVVDTQKSGLVDSSVVIREAVKSGVSGAALLLTTEVLVHRRNPPEVFQT